MFYISVKTLAFLKEMIESNGYTCTMQFIDSEGDLMQDAITAKNLVFLNDWIGVIAESLTIEGKEILVKIAP